MRHTSQPLWHGGSIGKAASLSSFRSFSARCHQFGWVDLRLFHKSLHFLREKRSFRSFHPRCPQKEPRNATQRVVEVELEALQWQLQDILQILPVTKLESGNIVLESMLQALILSEFETSFWSQYSMLFWFNSIQPSSTINRSSLSVYHNKNPSHSQPPAAFHFMAFCNILLISQRLRRYSICSPSAVLKFCSNWW